MATRRKRLVRTRSNRRPTLNTTIRYAAVAARGFHLFLEQCRAGRPTQREAIPVLGRIVEADPAVGRLALVYLQTNTVSR